VLVWLKCCQAVKSGTATDSSGVDKQDVPLALGGKHASMCKISTIAGGSVHNLNSKPTNSMQKANPRKAFAADAAEEMHSLPPMQPSATRSLLCQDECPSPCNELFLTRFEFLSVLALYLLVDPLLKLD